MRLTENGNLLIGGTWDGAKLSTDAKDQSNQINYSNVSWDYHYAEVSNVNRAYTKSWVVTYNWQERFAVWGNGIVYGYDGFYTGCDSIFKENIDSISDPLSKVLLLRGIKYNSKPEQLNPGDSVTVLPTEVPITKFGVIAQEVETIVPEAVIKLPDGTKAVSYNILFAILLEAVKKQQEIISRQNNEIISLKNENDLQNTRLKAIEDCVDNLPQGLCGKPHGKPKSYNNDNNDNINQVDYINIESTKAKLFQNNPNPFNEKTRINYILPESTEQSQILIFDMQGKLIRSINNLSTGFNSITIESYELIPGMYIYSLIVNNKEIDTKRLILTK